MKQSAAKTLGVAALGAAFAAAGAGAANAAPAVPDASQALGTVTKSLPSKTGLAAAQPVAEKVLAGDAAKSGAGLLGGLPVQALPANGLPLG
ncbi:ATP-binding protein [Streptomyces sp. NPDC005202]|uniref:ATP-binding protein n=1 Tax=Streptomyces sp. NPDC005202 TaxID=3157021 RepID=UPI0033AB4D42